MKETTEEWDDVRIREGESWESYHKRVLRQGLWESVEDIAPYAIVAGAFIWAMVWMFR